MTVVTKQAWLDSAPWIDRPDADIDAYLARLDEDPGFDLRSALECWRRDGVVVFEQAIEPALLDAFEADLQELRTRPEAYDLTVEVRGSRHIPIAEVDRSELGSPGVKFNHMHTVSGHAVRLSLHRAVSGFLRHVFQHAPCVTQSLTFYKGSQQPIHIDYPYVRTQTSLAHLAASWIPLEDIHADSGPLAYYPGSHRVDVSGFFDWGEGSILYERNSGRTPMDFAHYLWDRMREQGVEPQVFLPRRGDVLVWHGNLAHEGTRIIAEDRTRKSYVTHYTSLEAYPERLRSPHALDNGLYLMANGGYAFDLPWREGARTLQSFASLR